MSYTNTKQWESTTKELISANYLRNPWLNPSAFLIPRSVKQVDFETISKNKIEFKDLNLEIPEDLQSLVSIIEKSKSLMKLEENWDDEGGLPISYTTWKRATLFLIDYAKWLYENFNFVIPLPQVNPGPNNSIDLLWRDSYYRLLVNIPADNSKSAEYYGDNCFGDNSIKGKLKTNSIQEYFALWLKNLKK